MMIRPVSIGMMMATTTMNTAVTIIMEDREAGSLPDADAGPTGGFFMDKKIIDW
jgi:hypothetical protein